MVARGSPCRRKAINAQSALPTGLHHTRPNGPSSRLSHHRARLPGFLCGKETSLPLADSHFAPVDVLAHSYTLGKLPGFYHVLQGARRNRQALANGRLAEQGWVEFQLASRSFQVVGPGIALSPATRILGVVRGSISARGARPVQV